MTTEDNTRSIRAAIAELSEVVSTKLPPAQVAELDRIAQAEDRTRSSVVRRLVIAGLEHGPEATDSPGEVTGDGQ
jgi:metal-responsive CopG/Arc/MetJ family transcriptional regulator